ncbi:MAG: zinc ribbon domain-containing protein [Proteobacteria bacterium]|nr:zinc ribbon domain-containing protein [Pseudomonadota bacterium]
MPIYEYQCEEGHVFELLQKIEEPELVPCRNCSRRAHRILSPAHFVLKGPGFYVNDYKKKTDTTQGTRDKEHAKPEKKEKEKNVNGNTS